VVYDLFKHTLGPGPIYAALGNHDSYDQYALPVVQSDEWLLTCLRRAQDAPHSLGGSLAGQFSWLATLIHISRRNIEGSL
jgi:sphingomyelin phosphodiesterase